MLVELVNRLLRHREPVIELGDPEEAPEPEFDGEPVVHEDPVVLYSPRSRWVRRVVEWLGSGGAEYRLAYREAGFRRRVVFEGEGAVVEAVAGHPDVVDCALCADLPGYSFRISPLRAVVWVRGGRGGR